MTDAVERRTADLEWKEAVDEKLKEGQKTFEKLLHELSTNTNETKQINKKLDDHVERYDQFTAKLTPVVEAMESMQPGIAFFGQLGRCVAWIGKWFRRAIIWLTPIVAFGLAVWHYMKGEIPK